jgi:hypothetical protein
MAYAVTAPLLSKAIAQHRHSFLAIKYPATILQTGQHQAINDNPKIMLFQKDLKNESKQEHTTKRKIREVYQTENLPVTLECLSRDLGSYLFNCNGVPTLQKTEALMSHEHRDEIVAPRELLLRYPDITIHVASETVAVLKNKAKTGVASDVVSSFIYNFRKKFLVHETFNIYRVGDCLPVNGFWLIRLEHDSPDVMFRSRVTFGFAKPRHILLYA